MVRVASIALLLALLAAGCDGGTSERGDGGKEMPARDAAMGTGGSRAAGGASGTGGASASGAPGSGGAAAGGMSSSGGGAAKGGMTGVGGATPTGGKTGTGGTKQTGGKTGSGGTAGTGGTKQAGGATSSGGAAGASAAGGATGSGGVTYTTSFDLTESPLSESGAWHHDGLDWTRVDSGGGIAFGTQALGVARSGPGQYNDSYAYLSGFPADQQASGVIHLGSIDGSCTHEVEILMRWADSAHVARGYECNLAFDGSYAQIVRWNGAVGDFTYLNSGSVPGGVHDGDTLSASIVGDKITLSVNGVVRASAQDSTYSTGNPGIGLWRGSSGCGSNGDYGFTSFTARPAP